MLGLQCLHLESVKYETPVLCDDIHGLGHLLLCILLLNQSKLDISIEIQENSYMLDSLHVLDTNCDVLEIFLEAFKVCLALLLELFDPTPQVMEILVLLLLQYILHFVNRQFSIE